MVAAAAQLSLIDDWRRRRHRLAGESESNPQARFQIRMLDYLIRRYGDSPAAQAPARFPLRECPQQTDRAIIVHQELSRRTAQVRTPRDANQRVAAIVRRMSEPNAARFMADDLVSRRQAKNWLGDAVERAVSEWRRRVAAVAIDETTNELRRFLLQDGVREEAAKRMRSALADENTAVRLEAIAFLGRIGTLDDIGLLADLLALPPKTDEDRLERKGLLLAMQRISRR